MRMLSFGRRIMLLAGLCLGGGIGVASLTPTDLEGHRSSLRAAVTMMDGSTRNVTLEGVGCPTGMCSRVKARESKTGSLWLDGFSQVRVISHDAGPVAATFAFKDGTEREAAIMVVNRVLYVRGHFGRTERLDLGSVAAIRFE
jgi:hypothetical protein